MNTEIRAIVEPMAAARSIPLAHLLAVIDVESDGRVFHDIKGKRFPLILFEPHLLYRMTEGDVRARLVAEKLASRKWNRALYPKSQEARWAQVKRASEIAGKVAYEAVSYGVGQVLGQHWRALGFASIGEFVERMCSGAEGQIDIMLRYIDRNGLDDELREGRWPGFFRGYNGPAWEKNGYGRKIETALRRYGGATAEPDGMLRMGAKGARVRELQALLVRAGYQVKVDGDFGSSTKLALRGYQAANGLKADGVYGPETERAIGELRQSATDKPGDQKVTEIKEVLEGVGGIGGGILINQAKEAVESATGQLQQYEGLSQFVGYGLTALSIIAAGLALAGIGWAAWGWWHSRRTVEV